MSERSPPSMVIALVACAIGLAILVGATDLVGNDTPDHLFAAFASNHLHERAFGFARFYEAQVPLTGHGYVEIVRVLEPALGWRGAHRTALVVLVELMAFAFVILVMSTSRQRWPVALLGFPLALSWMLYVGDYPLYAGAALAIFALSRGVRAPTAASSVVLALLLAGAALCDPLPALASMVGVVVLGATRARRALLFAGACLPAAVLVYLGRAALASDAGALPWSPTSLVALADHVVAGSWVRGVMHALLVAVALAIAVMAPNLSAPNPSTPPAFPGTCARPAAVVGALLLIASFVAAVLGGHGTRAAALFVSLASALLLAQLPFERASAVVRRALAVAIAAWLVFSGVSAALLHRAMARATEPALGLLDSTAQTARFAPTALRQPLVTAHVDDVGIPSWNPLRQVGKLYAIAGVGVAPAPALTPRESASAFVLPRADLPAGIDAARMPGLAPLRDDERADHANHAAQKDIEPGAKHDAVSAHAREVVQLGSSSRGTGRVFIFGRDGDIDALVRRGWRIEARTARAALLAFHGCDVTISVSAPGARTIAIAPRVQTGAIAPEIDVKVEGPGDVAVRGLTCGAAVVTSTPPCANDGPDGRRDTTIVNGNRVFCAP